MTDFKLENGDIAADSSGKYIRLDGADALFQRAVICMSVKLGSFIYDRKIGSYSDTLDKNDEYYPQRLELVLNEAVAGFENTYVKVLECENAITVEVTIEGERRTEVLLNGNI